MWRSLWRSGCFGLMCLVWLTSVTVGQSLHEIQTSLQGLDAAFVLNDLRTGAFLRLNEPRCAERFAPFATLEISVALAALDTRIVRNLDLVTPWNQLKYPLRATDAWELTHWTEDQTLRSAFTDSVEWYWPRLDKF